MKRIITVICLLVMSLLSPVGMLWAQKLQLGSGQTQVTGEEITFYTYETAKMQLTLQWPQLFSATGFQFDLTLPEGVTLVQVQVMRSHMEEGTVQMSLLPAPATRTYRIVGLAKEGSTFSHSTDALLQLTLTADRHATGGQQEITVSNYLLTNVLGVTSVGVASTLGLTLYLKGDVDRNFVVDQRDVVAAQEILLEQVTAANNPKQYDLHAANFYEGDDVVTARDIVGIIALTKPE